LVTAVRIFVSLIHGGTKTSPKFWSFVSVIRLIPDP